MTSEPTNKNLTDSLMNSSKDSDGSNEEETAFEKRLTKTLCKLMKKELRSVKSDMKALKTGQDKQDKSIQELLSVKEENRLLKIECDRVLTENMSLKERITKIENSLLDNNIILHGIPEDSWELDSNRLEKIVYAISFTMDKESEQDQLDVARKIRIKSTRRLGIYNSKRSRPVFICFERFCDADYILSNKRFLPEGVYADKEYSEETENNR